MLVRAGDGGEQLSLCGEIIFHAVVIVEVILCQVGEQCAGKAHSGNTVLIQRMGGDFHDCGVDARIPHGGKTFMDIHAARRGQGGGFLVSRPAVAHRAQHADPAAA